MKYIFVVYVREANGKYCAYADTIKAGENLVSHIERNAATVCHLCETRMQAESIALEWNETYKRNGTHMFY